MSNPDEIRAQIEATRAGLSQDVNELGDKVSPAKIADRQKAKLRGSVTSVKEHIMGAADDAKSSTSGAIGSVKDHIMGAAGDAKSSTGSAVSSAGDAVSATPGKVVSQTKGNPMAAGLIAFGDADSRNFGTQHCRQPDSSGRLGRNRCCSLGVRGERSAGDRSSSCGPGAS